MNLEELYHPRSIAIVGVSRDFEKIGGKPMRNLIHHGYEGKIYPVNPRYDEVAGYPCYPRLLDVPGEIDLVLIAVSQARTLRVLEDCRTKRVKYVMLFGAGFAEAGEAGERIQDEALKLVREAGIRAVGPNCLGCINVKDRIPMGFSTSFEAERFLPGPVALVSQSGALGYALFALAQEEGVGFSYAANTGNQMDLHTLDFVSFMLEDGSTELVAGYLESIPDGERLISLSRRARELRKPLLLLKAGRSELGRRAAMSHTASLTGSGKIFEAVARQHGIVSLNDVDDTIDAMKIFARRKWVWGNRVAVVTTSGATGIMMADQCEDLGLEMVVLPEKTRERIEAVIPSYGSAMNPVDITAQALNDRHIFRETLRVLVEDDRVDSIILTTTFGRKLLKQMCLDVVKIDRETPKPIVAVLTGSQDIIGEGQAVLREARIPGYQSPRRATVALAHLVRFSGLCRGEDASVAIVEDDETVPSPPPGGVWMEEKVKEQLPRLGMRVPEGVLVKNRKQLEEVAAEVRYPVVAKVISPEILHKTDAGTLKVGIRDPEELVRAYDKLLRSAKEYSPQAKIAGILVEEMVEDPGVEMFIGVEDDPQFGPIILCGLGGIFVEVFEDVAIRRAPIGVKEAGSMLAELKGYPLLTGARGARRMDVEALTDALVNVSCFAYRHRGALREMDLNPVAVRPEGEGVVALDGMVVWADSRDGEGAAEGGRDDKRARGEQCRMT